MTQEQFRQVSDVNSRAHGLELDKATFFNQIVYDHRKVNIQVSLPASFALHNMVISDFKI